MFDPDRIERPDRRDMMRLQRPAVNLCVALDFRVADRVGACGVIGAGSAEVSEYLPQIATGFGNIRTTAP